MSKTISPEQKILRDQLLHKLINLGWCKMQCFDEIVFVKHMFPKTDQKRSVIQLMISPSLGTGLYHFRRTIYTYDIYENNGELHLDVNDLDAFPLHMSQREADEVLYATENDLTLEGFKQFLVDNQWIQPEELKYFTMKTKERDELAKNLPLIEVGHK